jgi:hypothetical protein
MQADLIRQLEARRAGICRRWEDLLRVERSVSPLASPDILVHMFKLTLDELFHSLASAHDAGKPEAASCPCGRNPLLTYFSAGRQATREALVLAQAAQPSILPADRDGAMADLDFAYSRIAQREIESFCAVCQFRRTLESAPSLAGVS